MDGVMKITAVLLAMCPAMLVFLASFTLLPIGLHMDGYSEYAVMTITMLAITAQTSAGFYILYVLEDHLSA
jgi:hypothetical protein